MAERLFVPLATAPYRWFESGKKTWELRVKRGQYNTKNVRVGRPVELRRGYSTPDSIMGTIAEVVEAENIRAFFDVVPWERVICDPDVDQRWAAENHAAAILKTIPKGQAVIGFRVASACEPTKGE